MLQMTNGKGQIELAKRKKPFNPFSDASRSEFDDLHPEKYASFQSLFGCFRRGWSRQWTRFWRDRTFNPFSDASICFIYPFSLIYSLPINKFLIPMGLYHATYPRCNYRLVFRSHGSTLKLKASHVFINVQLMKRFPDRSYWDSKYYVFKLIKKFETPLAWNRNKHHQVFTDSINNILFILSSF